MVATRRFFLFGGAAAIATAKMALASGPAAVVHEAPLRIIKPRLLFEMNVRAADATEPAMVELRRSLTGRPILQFNMHPRSMVRWSAGPRRNQIVEMPNQLIVLSVEGGDADAWDVDMFYNEGGRHFVERHLFPSARGPMTRLAMEA